MSEFVQRIEIIKKVALFKGAYGDLHQKIAKISVLESMTKYDFIYEQGNEISHFYLLLNGHVKVGRFLKSGKEIIMDFISPVKEMGLEAMAGETNWNQFVKVISSQAQYLKLPISPLRDLMKSNPIITTNLIKLQREKIRIAQQLNEWLHEKTSSERIVQFLVEFAEKRGQAIGTETLLDFPYTHADISAHVRTSRQSVTELLSILRRKNLIHLNRKKLLIRDLQLLRSYGSDKTKIKLKS